MAYKDKDKQKEAYTYKPNAGFIYIIQCMGFPYYKIGHSVNPDARVDSLQIGVPFELKLEYAVAVQDMDEVEHKIQQRYKSKGVRGEWYMLTNNDLDDVKAEIVALKDIAYVGESYPAYLRKHPRTAAKCGFKDTANCQQETV